MLLARPRVMAFLGAAIILALGLIASWDSQAVAEGPPPLYHVTVVKYAFPNSPQDFQISGDLGAFTLDDDFDSTLPNSVTTYDVAPGVYTISEAPLPDGWQPFSIACTTSEGNLETASVTFDLRTSPDMYCVFQNEMPTAPSCEGRYTTIVGTQGNDYIPGSVGDTISGLAGNDIISGFYWTDRLCGDEGNDLIIGGRHDDVMNGGPGFDICIGGAGTDSATECEIVRSVP